MSIDLHPTKCNLCGGKVIFTSNSKIYGKEYGSGKCYMCTSCGAYVSTHKPRPDEAMGILADAEMRDMKRKCHEKFDKIWMRGSTGEKRHMLRNRTYGMLAERMNIPVEQCHFGYFDMDQLKVAYQKVLEMESENKREVK